MAQIIDCTDPDVLGVETSIGFRHGLKIALRTGAFSARRMVQADIASVAEVEGEQWRSAGRAAAGAIIGGVLTGGIGLLAGAAIGGRRRRSAVYLVTFNDGVRIVFQTTDGNVMRILDHIAQRSRAESLLRPPPAG